MPSQKSECRFCQFLEEKSPIIIADFKHCYAIFDQYPVSKGHLLLISKEHTEHWFTASEKTRLDMMQALTQMKEKLDLEFHPDGYNIGLNCAKAAGQTIFHLHMHLIPRYHGDLEDPKGGVRGVIPAKQKYS